MFRSIRLFVDVPLEPGVTAPLAAGQAHYLLHVMRSSAGDDIVVFDGRDGEFLARIAALRRDHGTLEIVRSLRPQAPEPDTWLLFAPLKRDATELVIEKATELGVSRIRPVITARTNSTRLNLDRLRAIAIEAAEQCERLTIPVIDPPEPLTDALANWPRGRTLVAAFERVAADPVRRPPGPTALLVGPEGGFADAELDALRRSPFIVPASLGPRILRAETAAIAGLALLMNPGD